MARAAAKALRTGSVLVVVANSAGVDPFKRLLLSLLTAGEEHLLRRANVITAGNLDGASLAGRRGEVFVDHFAVELRPRVLKVVRLYRLVARTGLEATGSSSRAR